MDGCDGERQLWTTLGSDAEHLSGDRTHPVVRNIETMTANTKGETEQCGESTSSNSRLNVINLILGSDRHFHDAGVESRDRDVRYVVRKKIAFLK